MPDLKVFIVIGAPLIAAIRNAGVAG